MANPGAATTQTANSQALSTQQALRLIGVAKGVLVSAAGDTAFSILGSTQNWVPVSIITSNAVKTSTGATTTVATATVGVYTQSAQGGTVILTTAALTSQAANTYVKIQAATNAATAVLNAGGLLYANVGTTVSDAQIDIFVYGYDLS